MKKEFIPYELALKMKQLGFDEPCFAQWDEMQLYPLQQGGESAYFETNKNSRLSFNTMAPTFSQAFRWFREEYDLRIWIESNHGVSKFEYVIATTNHNFIDKQFNDFSSYKTYEEAELACLEKLIEIVEQKNEN
jgi:ligand-binding sensor domain-containing protein